jgi:hypothetical protein
MFCATVSFRSRLWLWKTTPSFGRILPLARAHYQRDGIERPPFAIVHRDRLDGNH